MAKPTVSGEKKAGRYMGFKKLVKKLAAKKSLDFAKQIEFLMEKALVEKSKAFNPAAIAASVGRKKYGAKKFSRMAVAGKRRKMHKSTGKTFKAPIMKSK